ncbi:MAG: hypothetical protein GY714_20290 [Desulfobacterales bacterium]|nr:hypothetical protein [Desulfobacterales bacterium]
MGMNLRYSPLEWNEGNRMFDFGGGSLQNYSGVGATGDVRYLHSTTGLDYESQGRTKDKPYKTLDFALGQLTANQNDVLYIMPGHSETISAAGGITLDVAGVNIIGLGRYDLRPTFTFTSAGTMLVTAANVAFEGCKLVAGVADIAVGILITAKGFRLAHNTIEDNGALNWIDVIHVSAADNDADGLEIIGNEILTQDDATVTAIDLLKNINDAKIIGNKIVGDFNATPFAPIYMADNEIAKNILVTHNLIHNLHDADAAVGISMVEAVSTGWMMYNHCYALDVAGETPFLTGATGIYCSQNYYTYQATLSGFEYPAIGTLS